MPLPEPRKGESLGFHAYPSSSNEVTLGNPEEIIWSTLHHLCSRNAAEYYASTAHGVSSKRDRAALARNLKLYIQQASEFYRAAATAKPNTAPLIYYYSFLNLAKALCEMRNPRFHRRAECYAHGLGWKPNPRKLVELSKDKVIIRGRGVWHVLWESLTRMPFPAINHVSISVKKLFSYCPEICAEYMRIFGGPIPTIDLKNPDVLYDEVPRVAWLQFSVRREELATYGLYAPKLIAQVRTARCGYVEVKSANKELRTFQSEIAKTLDRRDTPWSAVASDVLSFNLFTHLHFDGKLRYSIPLQQTLPLLMPQLIVSYTLLFWLGSVVRYDPHSVHELMDSPYWILVDGFMTQSRVWLLELFEWALYRSETTLCMAR